MRYENIKFTGWAYSSVGRMVAQHARSLGFYPQCHIEGQAGESVVQGHTQLYSEAKASLDHMILYLKK